MPLSDDEQRQLDLIAAAMGAGHGRVVQALRWHGERALALGRRIAAGCRAPARGGPGRRGHQKLTDAIVAIAGTDLGFCAEVTARSQGPSSVLRNLGSTWPSAGGA